MAYVRTAGPQRALYYLQKKGLSSMKKQPLSAPDCQKKPPSPLPGDDDKEQVLPITMIASSDGSVRCCSFHDEQLPAADQGWISWNEIRIQCGLAGPLILGNLLSFLLQLVSTTFVGHTGSLELSGAALAYSFSVVTGYSVLVCSVLSILNPMFNL